MRREIGFDPNFGYLQIIASLRDIDGIKSNTFLGVSKSISQDRGGLDRIGCRARTARSVQPEEVTVMAPIIRAVPMLSIVWLAIAGVLFLAGHPLVAAICTGIGIAKGLDEVAHQ